MDEAGRAIQGGARLRPAVAAALAILAVLAFLRVGDGVWLTYDDEPSILWNEHLQHGFSAESLAWSLTTTEASNWYPLTWLTHIADFSLYGKNPRGHHFTNLALHAANAILLFLVLEAMTGALWKSAFVGAVFAVHPMQVEPVAWIFQRKTMLSTLFFLLTLDAWRRYAGRPGAGRYAVVFMLTVLALFSKPMAVTTPFVLLLLDFWPLGRLTPAPTPGRRKRAGRKGRPGAAPEQSAEGPAFWPRVGRLAAEKVPLLVLSAVVSAVTVVAQKAAEVSVEVLPLGMRIANAIHAYTAYLGKFLWPRDLGVFYPHPGLGLSTGSVLVSLLVLGAITAIAWRVRTGVPAVLVGWLWYLGTLVPVIGFVQVGLQGMADRYMYTPMIGLLIMTAWGGERLLGRRVSPALVGVTAAGAVAALAGATWVQTGYWRSNAALFEQTIRVTGPNPVAQLNLAETLMRSKRIDEAIAHYRESLRISPLYAEAHYNFAEPLVMKGRIAEAESHYREAVRLKPGMYPARYNLALLLMRQKKYGEAEAELREAIRLDPDLAPARYTLGNLLARQGRLAEALPEFEAAVRLRPDDREARLRLSRVQEMLAAGSKPQAPAGSVRGAR